MINAEMLTRSEMIAENRLQSDGFTGAPIENMELPTIQVAEMLRGTVVPYATFGDTREAETVTFAVSPYSTRVADEAQLLRLKAQQTALGPKHAVVGLQVYDTPHLQRLTKGDKRHIKEGSFKPFAERVATVIDKIKLVDEQKLRVYGYSLGADTAVELAHLAMFDSSFGKMPIERFAAIEPARVQKRGVIAVANAFKNSGEDMFDNVMLSDSPALLTARDIDPEDDNAKKKHEAAVAKVVTTYTLEDMRGNLAILRGFTHDTTLQQLNDMAGKPQAPKRLVGHMEESTVCTPEFMAALQEDERLTTFEAPGDHSTADNLKKSAAFMVALHRL